MGNYEFSKCLQRSVTVNKDASSPSAKQNAQGLLEKEQLRDIIFIPNCRLCIFVMLALAASTSVTVYACLSTEHEISSSSTW